MPSSEHPLVVDMDGTLIRADLLHETASQYLSDNPLRIVRLAGWTMAGKHALKERLAEATPFDPAALPYHEEVIEWLRAERAKGRPIVLATASHRRLAQAVADHLDLFDTVLATGDGVNLKAEAKRDALVALYGEKGFDYVGNDGADLAVWAVADKAYLVDSSAAFADRVRAVATLDCVFADGRKPAPAALFRALRPHQWVKNLLIFVPILAAHHFRDVDGMIAALIAFLVFGLTASSAYILNDLADVADDRHHRLKRHRPFAAGDLSLLAGWALWPALLLIAGLIAALALPPAFVGVLAIYFVVTVAYSLRLKQVAIVDVLVLAGLYSIRIVAGAAATNVPLSFWLLTFALFIFLSLALIKRVSELLVARASGRETSLRGRSYGPQDLEMLSAMGVGAGYLSVLVLALYIHDAQTAELYASPRFIWLACPILLYWISRAWLITHRGQMHDDPIVFAIKDKASILIGVGFLGVFALAKGLG
ncbi:UbiA family prenyltransferase [Sphingomonas montanisoli]|uniref:UbiA family prenyltransferase n=1 Tax=Sphingomonas montanisoli TaxID=2606412 RepID=A0A5D9C7U1_9SPHN|nr:UbiA family prenyltransferase [Sphingomonas montanisoli]TZG27834.1 UbiA family prenyltransferase [Sphingomonas montanisoli]